MNRWITTLTLCAALTACVSTSGGGASGLSGSTGLAGDWVDAHGAHYSLDADGILGLPGQTARCGLTWSRQGEVLVLRTLETPGGEPREDRLGIVRVSPMGLELRAADGRAITWSKSRDKVRRLEGSLIYRERMALPPEVTVGAQLFLPGSDTPLAASLARVRGQIPLPFRLHYLAKDAPHVTEALVTGAVYYEHNGFFLSEKTPVKLDGENEPIIMFRVLPEVVAPAALSTPAQFRGAPRGKKEAVTLYLEPDGLYVLHDEAAAGEKEGAAFRMGRWRQIDRNHTVQLELGASAPLNAALRPAGSLLLSGPGLPGGEVELMPVMASLHEERLSLTGEFRMPAGSDSGQAVFVHAASGLELPVRRTEKADAALREAGWNTPVQVEAHLVYRGAAPAPTRQLLPADGPQAVHELDLLRVTGPAQSQPVGETYAGAPLEHTYWRLTSLNGKAAQSFPDQAEPHLILREGGQVSGSDGCNNFFMSWSGEGNSIHFGLGGSTLMLCPHGEAQAREMMNTLSQADAWNIRGSVLELLREGSPIAVFEAVAL